MFWVWCLLILGFLFESIEKVVNIEKKWKYRKSIAENDFTFRQYVLLYCVTFWLCCGGGCKGIATPCTFNILIASLEFFPLLISVIYNYLAWNRVLCNLFNWTILCGVSSWNVFAEFSEQTMYYTTVKLTPHLNQPTSQC